MQVRVTPEPASWGFGFEVRIVEAKSHSAVETLTLKRLEPGEIIPVAMRLQAEEAQEFMDALYSAGVRPSEGIGSAGSLKATQEHLEDMRTIAFKNLGIKK